MKPKCSRPLIGLLLSIALWACHASAQSRSSEKLRVLFIGNSLIHSHDIPAIVAALAKSAKKKRLEYQTIAYPDYSLEDHWNEGDARKAIAGARWDIVVLQQGPSSLPESRVLLREYVGKFAAEIRRAGAKPALYMVWPARSRTRDFERSIESYKLAAAEVDGILLPVGVGWHAALRRNPPADLYDPDGLHPSVLGSYLSALIIFEKLYASTNEIPAKLKIDSPQLNEIELTPAQQELIRSAAREATLNK